MKIFIDSNIPIYVAGADHPRRASDLHLLDWVRAPVLLEAQARERPDRDGGRHGRRARPVVVRRPLTWSLSHD